MGLIYFVIEIIAKVVVVFAVLMGVVAYLTLAERKILGRIQVRYGPNRVVSRPSSRRMWFRHGLTRPSSSLPP
jgi:NADH:ubiquinone oxidoreductase subunit H